MLLRLFSLLLFFVLSWQTSVFHIFEGNAWGQNRFPKPTGLVNDFADVIPISYKKRITGISRQMMEDVDTPLVVVTMPDIAGADYNQYAVDLYNTWGIGEAGVNKGVLFFVTIKERKIRIVTGLGTEKVLTDQICEEILKHDMMWHLKMNHFGEAFLRGAIAVDQEIRRNQANDLRE